MREVRRRATASQPRQGFRNPGQVIAGGFAGAVAVGTLLLSLPAAAAGPGAAPFEHALFMATSAVCVTGLATVDVGTYWSGFGQAVIMLLMQVGGLGIMTLATLFALLVSRRLGLRARLVAQAETKALTGADVRRVIRRVVFFSLGCEAVVTVVLGTRLLLAHDLPLHEAAYSGLFHAVSAFNNGGLSTYPDSMVRFVGDPWITVTIAVTVIVGGLGFPVVFELVRSWRHPSSWSVLTRITVTVSTVLLVVGTAVVLAAEGTNARTLGALDPDDRVTAAFFTAVMPRSGGLNVIDMGDLKSETLFAIVILMFIGGGSAGTAGGIKVTTFGLLAYVMWAEMRGEPDVGVGRRRVPASTQRQALSVALLGVGMSAVATFVLLALTEFRFEDVLFEAVSAAATVGLSTGITPDLPPAAHYVMVVLMYVGRIGPLTLATALAVREGARRFQLPEERTIVG